MSTRIFSLRLDQKLNGGQVDFDQTAIAIHRCQTSNTYGYSFKPPHTALRDTLTFNRSFRHEVLQAHLFGSLDDVREHAWDWLVRYNEERPHAALGNLPPSRFRQRQTNPGNSPI